jgi:hypothetical protein
LKTFFINLLVSLLAILSPVKPLLLTVGFLIIVDFIFGIWRAKKLGETITSRKMSNTLSKMVLYNLAILSVYLLGKYVIDTGLPLEKIAAGLISIIEIKSLDESFQKIFGFSLWQKIAKAINRGSSTTKDILNDIEEK